MFARQLESVVFVDSLRDPISRLERGPSPSPLPSPFLLPRSGDGRPSNRRGGRALSKTVPNPPQVGKLERGQHLALSTLPGANALGLDCLARRGLWSLMEPHNLCPLVAGEACWPDGWRLFRGAGALR